MADVRRLSCTKLHHREGPVPPLDELGRASWFSKLDLRQGFHQILMADEDVATIVFRTHEGHYEYRAMPFGLCNASSTFQAAMTTMLCPFLSQFAMVFFDDILVYSATFTDHVHHLQLILQALIQHRYHLKYSKCSFGQRQLDYLGHVISGRGVQPDPSKIQAIIDWLIPRNAKELCTFLGLTGFYRKFVQGYAAIAIPLTSLLSKDTFGWSPESQAAFEQLKTAMTSAPVLTLLKFDLPFTLETNTFGVAMGAILLQQGNPIAFFSKAFCPHVHQASAYVQELYAITIVIRKWR